MYNKQVEKLVRETNKINKDTDVIVEFLTLVGDLEEYKITYYEGITNVALDKIELSATIIVGSDELNSLTVLKSIGG